VLVITCKRIGSSTKEGEERWLFIEWHPTASHEHVVIEVLLATEYLFLQRATRIYSGCYLSRW
jgi:hypothetical protein